MRFHAGSALVFKPDADLSVSTYGYYCLVKVNYANYIFKFGEWLVLAGEKRPSELDLALGTCL